MLTCFDDANVAQFSGLTDQADVFAGYVDNFITFPWIEANRPHNPRMSITLYGNVADALDIEPGGATVAMAPGHFNRWHNNRAAMHTSKPVLYTMAGNSGLLLNTMARAGISRNSFLLWSAHIGRGQHICSPSSCGYPQADGTQWTWTALGRSLDESLLENSFYDGSTPTPVNNFVTEDSMLVIDSAVTDVSLALPVGSSWLTFFSSDSVLLNVTLENDTLQSVKLTPGHSVTISTKSKRGAHVVRAPGQKSSAEFGVSVA